MFIKALSVILILLITFMFYKNNKLPSYLGVHNGKLAAMPSSPNAVSTQTDVQDKKIEAIPYSNAVEAKVVIKKALAELGNNALITEENQYLHIVFTTPTMRYKDDVEIWLDEEHKLIHYRSQSRVGYSDRGLNKTRFQQFKLNFNNLTH